MEKKNQEYWESRPEIYNMLFSEFADEYAELMPIMESKELVGNLTPHSPNYVPMTEQEKELHEKDWKAFSRSRGYSEYDIAEYARWHKITGQTDKFPIAFNDPWRRGADKKSPLENWDKRLYLQHIQKAIADNIKIPEEIMQTYLQVNQYLQDFDDPKNFYDRQQIRQTSTSQDNKNLLQKELSVEEMKELDW